MTATFTPRRDAMPARLSVAFRLDETAVCGYCGAAPGHSCSSRSGRTLRRPHASRARESAVAKGEAFTVPLDGGGSVSFTPAG